MTDFYSNIDRWVWPLKINTNNHRVKIIEDPNGTADTISVTLSHSDSVTGEYYAVGHASPVSSSNSAVKVVEDSFEALYVYSLYHEIVDKLRAESANSGNSLDYQIEAIQPSGSDYDNTGLRLTTSGGSTDIVLDFSDSDALSPRFFGWDASELNGSSQTSTGTEIDGPFSRWGVWYNTSEKLIHDKRPQIEQELFTSSDDPRDRILWEFGDRQIKKPIQYIGVPGAVIWPDDRADRTVEADRAGLPTGDANDALYDLWRHSVGDDKHVVIGHGDGEAQLGSTVGSNKATASFDSARILLDWADMWHPQDDQRFDQHEGERYDLAIQYAAARPEDIPVPEPVSSTLVGSDSLDGSTTTGFTGNQSIILPPDILDEPVDSGVNWDGTNVTQTNP